LCLAGGVALNCVGNGKILKKSKFKNIWIQPAAGDAGGALGTALFIWHRYLDNKRESDNLTDKQKGSYLGPEYSKDIVKKFIDENNLIYEELLNDEIPSRLAALINEQNVIGFFQGKMEFGPRALGARSIIGDARSLDMQSIMNLKIKFRESFRPFAPAVLKENVSEYFDVDCESPYMLLVSQVKEDKINQDSKQAQADGIDKLKIKRSSVPAITHVDYSARVQTVTKQSNAVFYDTIREFYKLSGCPVVINTSFNIRGEPIVCTPEDAYRCFMSTDMDYLIIGNFLFDKKKQPKNEKYRKENISLILD